MSKKTTYSCDICREVITDLEKLIGLNFSGMKKFKLDTFRSTDGVHICHECARQLYEQIDKMAMEDGSIAL